MGSAVVSCGMQRVRECVLCLEECYYNPTPLCKPLVLAFGILAMHISFHAGWVVCRQGSIVEFNA